MNPLNRFLGVLSLLVLAPLCHAVPVLYTAVLSGANEVGPNASPGTGSVSVLYDASTHTLQVNTTFSGLLGPTTAAHIHAPAAAGATAGVATQTPTFLLFPLGVTAGTYASASFDLTLSTSWNSAFITSNGGTPASAEAAFATALSSGAAYFNIHTTSFPGGELRGNLAAGVPDSGLTAILLAPVLIGLIGAARRLRPTT